MMGRAFFEGSFMLVYSVQVKNVGDERVIGCPVLHFKPSALIRWSVENSQVSATQFQVRKSTDF